MPDGAAMEGESRTEAALPDFAPVALERLVSAKAEALRAAHGCNRYAKVAQSKSDKRS